MELQKNLPKIFKKFAEGRRNAFIKAKELKDKDIPLIGVFCTYFPQEIALSETFRITIEGYLNRKVFTNNLCQYAGAIGAAVIGYRKIRRLK